MCCILHNLLGSGERVILQALFRLVRVSPSHSCMKNIFECSVNVHLLRDGAGREGRGICTDLLTEREYCVADVRFMGYNEAISWRSSSP